MASGLLSLKWNHHRSTFLHVLANIRQKESYCDVTLACAGKFYSAHKLVLSTCSEYFEEMFERTQCKHPVIVLKDIGADELEALLSYMYDGEVNVLQENLSSLIKAAECLKIKGLAVADSDPSEHSSKSTKDKSSSSSSNSNGKDVHRSHNSNSTSNSNNHSFQSDSSSRQFRNSSGGVKRPSLSSKQDDGPSKRRRPEPSSLSSAAASPARRQSTERPSSAPRGGAADAKDGDDGGSDGADGGEDGGNSMEGTPSAADDHQPHEDGGPEDARSFAQGLSEQTGVKAEPVEIIDSDDMGGFDPQTGDGGSHDASDAEFTEEKFASGGADANDPSLWGGGANNDMFSQPSTSSFTGQDGSNSNDNNSGGGKGGGGSSGLKYYVQQQPPNTKGAPSQHETTNSHQDVEQQNNLFQHILHPGSLVQFEESNPLRIQHKSESARLEEGEICEYTLLPGSSQEGGNGPAWQSSRPLLDSASRVPVYCCHVCRFAHTNQETIIRHSLVHMSESSHSCDRCTFATEDLEDLDRHLIAHSNGTLQTCLVCPYVSHDLDLADHHYALHHWQGLDEFFCNECSFVCDTLDGLCGHAVVHKAQGKCVCEVCGKRFQRPSQVVIHQRVHTGEKPFACTLCDFRCNTKFSLKRHVNFKHEMARMELPSE